VAGNTSKYDAPRLLEERLKIILLSMSKLGTMAKPVQTTKEKPLNRNGKRKKPKAVCVIIDHVNDEDGDGA
jgi:hypothetical protein